MKGSTQVACWVRKLAAFAAMLVVAVLTLATSYGGRLHQRELVGHSVLPAESSERGVLLSVESESVLSDVSIAASPGVTLHVVDKDGTLTGATGSLVGFCHDQGCNALELRILRDGMDGELEVEISVTVTVSDLGSGATPIVIELEFID